MSGLQRQESFVQGSDDTGSDFFNKTQATVVILDRLHDLESVLINSYSY